MNLKNAVQTKDGALVLDAHKLSYHFDRVQSWENGERIAPITVDMALSRACGAMSHSAMPWFKSHKRGP